MLEEVETVITGLGKGRLGFKIWFGGKTQKGEGGGRSMGCFVFYFFSFSSRVDDAQTD